MNYYSRRPSGLMEFNKEMNLEDIQPMNLTINRTQFNNQNFILKYNEDLNFITIRTTKFYRHTSRGSII